MYNSKWFVIVIMEVFFMINKLLAQLKILKLSQLKPNFSELARMYGFDRRTIKKYYDGYNGKPSTPVQSSPPIHRSQNGEKSLDLLL